jgi:hypothetical protein
MFGGFIMEKYRCPLCNQEVTKKLYEKISRSRQKKERGSKDITSKRIDAVQWLMETAEDGKKAIEKEQRPELKEKLQKELKEELVMMLSYFTRKGLL